MKLSGGKLRSTLCDISKCKAISKEARNHHGQGQTSSALALVGGSPIGNIIGNIFLAVHGSRQNPIKLFTAEAEAVQWLKGYLP